MSTDRGGGEARDRAGAGSNPDEERRHAPSRAVPNLVSMGNGTSNSRAGTKVGVSVAQGNATPAAGLEGDAGPSGGGKASPASQYGGFSTASPAELVGGGMGADARTLKRLLKALSAAREAADGGAALYDTLSQLCDLITYSGDDALLLAGFGGVMMHGAGVNVGSNGGERVHQHLKDLLVTLQAPDPSLQLMATKVLTQVFEQVPPCVALALDAGVAVTLTDKLLSVEWMDVAEQAIAALEHVARYSPAALLSCGTLGALLAFLDFYPLDVQRQALRTVAHICSGPLRVSGLVCKRAGGLDGPGGEGEGERKGERDSLLRRSLPQASAMPLESPCMDVNTFETAFLGAAPALTQLLHHAEGAVVELAALALLRASQSFLQAADGDTMRAGQYAEGLAGQGLVRHSIQLLAQAVPDHGGLLVFGPAPGGGQGPVTELTPAMAQLLLRLLGSLGRYSAKLCSEMIDLGLPLVLQGLLAGEVGGAPVDRLSALGAPSIPAGAAFAVASPPSAGPGLGGAVGPWRRGRSLSFGASSPGLTGGSASSQTTARTLLACLLDLLPIPSPFLPVHLDATSGLDNERVPLASVHPRAGSGGGGGASCLHGTPGLLRVLHPHGAVLTPVLDPRSGSSSAPSSRQGGGSAGAVVSVDLGTVLPFSGWAACMTGARRYRTPCGWISARVATDSALSAARAAATAVVSSVPPGFPPSSFSTDALCEVVDGPGSDSLARAKLDLVIRRQALSGPLLGMLPHLLDLARAASSHAFRSLCARVLCTLLHDLSGPALLEPLFLDQPHLVPQLAGLIARMLPTVCPGTGVGTPTRGVACTTACAGGSSSSSALMITLSGMSLALLLLQKVPSVFVEAFSREGIVAQITEQLREGGSAKGAGSCPKPGPCVSPLSLPGPWAAAPPDFALSSPSSLPASTRAVRAGAQEIGESEGLRLWGKASTNASVGSEAVLDMRLREEVAVRAAAFMHAFREAQSLLELEAAEKEGGDDGGDDGGDAVGLMGLLGDGSGGNSRAQRSRSGSGNVMGVLGTALATLEEQGRAETRLAAETLASLTRRDRRIKQEGLKDGAGVLALLVRVWKEVRRQNAGHRESCEAVVRSLCLLLASRHRGGGLSNFELLTSGFVPRLLAFLRATEVERGELLSVLLSYPLAGGSPRKRKACAAAEKKDGGWEGEARVMQELWALLKRLLRRERATRVGKLLLEVRGGDGGRSRSSSFSASFPSSSSPSTSFDSRSGSGDVGPGDSCFQILVGQLQSCLEASDRFLSSAALRAYRASGLEDRARPSPSPRTVSTLLAHPMQLRLRCLTAETDSRLGALLQAQGLGNISLLIDPLASVRTIREFLNRRLQNVEEVLAMDEEEEGEMRSDQGRGVPVKGVRSRGRGAAVLLRGGRGDGRRRNGGEEKRSIVGSNEGHREEEEEEEEEEGEEEEEEEEEEDEMGGYGTGEASRSRMVLMEESEEEVEKGAGGCEEEDDGMRVSTADVEEEDEIGARGEGRGHEGPVSRKPLPFSSCASLASDQLSHAPTRARGRMYFLSAVRGGREREGVLSSPSPRSLGFRASEDSQGAEGDLEEGMEVPGEAEPGASRRKKAEEWDPRPEYEMRCAEIVVNGLPLHLEDSPILEAACASLLQGGGQAARSEDGEEDAACDLGLYGTAREGGGATLVVTWTLRRRGRAREASTVPATEAIGGTDGEGGDALRRNGSVEKLGEEGGRDGLGTHMLSPRWWVAHPVDEFLASPGEDVEAWEDAGKGEERNREALMAREETTGGPQGQTASGESVVSTPTLESRQGPGKGALGKKGSPEARGGLATTEVEHGILLLLRLLYGLNRHMVSLLMPPMASPLSRSQEEVKDTLGDADPASHVLAHAAARELVSSGGVREECWVIKPLSERMAQELQDPVALATQQLPGWCDQLLRYGPFLLQFRVRKEYFHLSSFGLGRAVHRLLQQQRQGMDGQGGGGGGGGEGGGTGRHASHDHSHQGSHHHHHHHQYRRAPTSAVQQLKVQVSRRKLLASAEKVLEEHGSRRVLLETEFFNEPGTGSGPTAEFFSLVSKEMRSPNLGLWRGESHHDGLYPQPWSDPTGGSEERMKDQKGGGGRPEGGRGQKLRQFACLGRLIGQALLDERLLDIRFAAPLVATLAGRQASQSLPAALEEMERVDSALARQLQALAASTGLAQWFEAPESGQRSERQEQEVGPGKIVRESADADERVSALCLTFCLPGEPEIGLLGPSGVPVKPGVEGLRSDGGLGEDVTRQNLGLYVQRVLQVGLREAVRPQVTAMLTGLQDIVPTGALWVFTEEEITAMVGGVGSEMGKDPEEILEALACDHGYTRGSQAVRWLVEILAEMTLEEERHFLMFVTGSPGLPVGGLMGCCPRLTVVKKVAEGHARALGQAGVDAMLPSASTCTNYLKLPDYSSRAVMRERLLLSLRHGQHSFHLS